MNHSWLPFEWIVAMRFLRQGRLQTLFILAGIAIGVAVIVFMSAMLTGLRANFIRRVLSAQAHIQLLPPLAITRIQDPADPRAGPVHLAVVQAPPQRRQHIDQWQSLVNELKALPQIRTVSPVASGSALAIRGDASAGVTLIGVVPDQHWRIIHLDEKIVRGHAELTGGDLLIGTDLASDLGVDIADKVRLQVAEGFALVFTVRGIFDLGNRGANKQSVFLTLKNAQALLHIAGAVTSLEVNVEDVDQAQIIAETITQFANVQANSWIKTSAQFFTAIQAQTTANVAIRFFVGLAVALGIASVLVVSVVQRSREIGILRAMGISRAQVLRVFLLQGALLGLGGSILGCLIGTGALLLWQSLMRNPDGTPMVQLFLNTTLFLSTFALGSLTGLGAAVTPAIRAARLDPATAIRA